jgi:hypothetical protein
MVTKDNGRIEMDEKTEHTSGGLIAGQRKRKWDMRSEERKARRHKTKLRIAERKRGKTS